VGSTVHYKEEVAKGLAGNWRENLGSSLEAEEDYPEEPDSAVT
jgi:hypothetical protein